MNNESRLTEYQKAMMNFNLSLGNMLLAFISCYLVIFTDSNAGPISQVLVWAILASQLIEEKFGYKGGDNV